MTSRPPANDPPASHLTAGRRRRELDELSSSVVDLLVVGGGVTGCGVALDAASRGMSVALVERADLASGTSGWSSKLVHGGLRYLATGDVGLALESARERGTLLRRTAPHLVRPLAMAVPLGHEVGRRDGLRVDAGHRAADALRRVARTPRRSLPAPRRLSTLETVRLLPAVRREGLRGSLLAWDGQLEDDARLVVALARTAAASGARVLTRVTATAADGSGASVEDALTGATTRIRARAVVNATGAWADGLAPHTPLRPSKGVHVVVPAMLLGRPGAALTVPVPGERNRYVFALPCSDGLVHVGLTDDALDGPVPERAPVLGREVDFLLATLSSGLELPLTRADVVGSYAGVRPLLAGASGPTADLSRRHAVLEGEDGMWTVLGGKLTTYRRMAQDVVDQISTEPCRTRRLPLVGAGPVAEGLPPRLVRRYGSEAGEVAALAGTRPELLAPVAPGVPVLGVELAWGVRAEGALLPEDLLDRRTRTCFVDSWREAARPAAERALAVSV